MGLAIVHHHQENRDDAIVEAVVEGIKSRGAAFGVKPKDVQVVWDDDNKGMVVTAAYTKTVVIPVMNKKWIIRFNPTAKQRLDFFE